MIFEPLLQAPLAIQIHVATVVPAALLGAFLLAFPKGTPLHRRLGRIWMGLMIATAIASLFIHELRLVGPFSPIHLLSLLTLVNCARAIAAARRGDIARHRAQVLASYCFGIILAGLFTLVPGRTMHAVFFAGTPWTGPLAAGLFFLLLALPLPRQLKSLARGRP